jgi:two-component system sensor histidine kinase PilS (NtrC family)
MFASEGLGSGIGFLLLVVIATSALILSGQLPLFLAAMASIFVISGTVILISQFGAANSSLFPAALLGTLLFATALLFRTLNRRLLESENLASREAEQATHLQRLNETIVNRMQTGIVLLDEMAQIRLINRSAIDYLGSRASITHSSQNDLLVACPELFQQYEKWSAHPWIRCPPIVVAQTNTEIQCTFNRFDEQNEHHTVIFIEDTRSTAQNVQQLKLASLGRLAGSIAHEIRNPLSAISHSAQLLIEGESISQSNKLLIEIINRHSSRVDAIVDSVLTLSRQQAPTFEIIHLCSWLNTFVKEYIDSSEPEGTLELDCETNNLRISFDPGHLSQTLGNLIDNAFRYSKLKTGESWAKISCGIEKSSSRPFLDVFDKGKGVERQNLAHIFEPFFTTSNSGTGLGLYLAKERCEFNYSTLTYRIPGADTNGSFRITFPTNEAFPANETPTLEKLDGHADSINR